MGMHNNISQLVQMNFLSIFLRSSSAILVPGMMEKELQLQKEKQDFYFLECVLEVYMITTYSDEREFWKSIIANGPLTL